jgi:monomeric sarcosine oxidase
MTQTVDTIIVGAGAMGSAAAYYLSKQGQKVLLLEQFELDHQNGSSYGFSRIIRYSYDYPEYVDLAKDTYPLWFAVQEELGEDLYIKTGGIDFGPSDDEMFQNTIQSVKTSNIDHEMLSLEEAHKRFPQFKFHDDFKVLYQPDSGLIRASAAVLGHIKLAEKHGATIKANTPVESIDIKSDSVEVKTANETYSAGKLVVTAGSWAKFLLQQTGIDLPLTPLRCQLNFMMPDNLDTKYDTNNCPVWIAHVSGLYPETIYGLPSHHDSGFKIAFHAGAAVNHPSEINYTPDTDNVENLRKFMKEHIPNVANAPVRESRICLYTMTPDEHFIVDTHPEYSHVAIGAGFSGHGFKFSTTIGKMLTDIVLEGETPHNDTLFKINRFLD